MANTIVRGRHDNSNFPANTGKEIVDARIIALFGVDAPTMQLVSVGQAREMEESNDKFRWRTEDPMPNYLTVSGALTSSDVLLTVDEIDLAQEGQYLQAESGEILRITNLDSDVNTATVARGVNGSTAAAIADDEKLLLMPPALTATETAGYTPTTYGEFRQNFFCQFGWKMGQDFWSSAKPSWMLDDGERVRLERAKNRFLRAGNGQKARQMEVAIWYATGQAMGTNQRGYFKGISEFNNVNVSSSVGDLTYNDLMDHIHQINTDMGITAGSGDLREFALYGNSRMLAVWRAIATTYSTATRMQSERVAPNLRSGSVDTDFGRLQFRVIDQLRDGEIHGIDFSDVELVPGQFNLGPNGGLWTEFEQQPENLGYLAVEWNYFFRGSLKLGHPRKHFKMTGINLTGYPGLIGPTSSLSS